MAVEAKRGERALAHSLKSPSRVRFRANRTLSRHRRMTKCDPSRIIGHPRRQTQWTARCRAPRVYCSGFPSPKSDMVSENNSVPCSSCTDNVQPDQLCCRMPPPCAVSSRATPVAWKRAAPTSGSSVPSVSTTVSSMSGFGSQHCAVAPNLESILRARMPKIVLQHNRHFSDLGRCPT
jgi:hypothetical protein